MHHCRLAATGQRDDAAPLPHAPANSPSLEYSLLQAYSAAPAHLGQCLLRGAAEHALHRLEVYRHGLVHGVRHLRRRLEGICGHGPALQRL